MKTYRRPAAGLILAAVISACGDNSPLENTPAPTAYSSVISATGGSNLSGFYGNFVTGVPEVRLADNQGQPRSGVPIRFEAVGGGALTGFTTTTDAAGKASPTSWRLGVSGEQAVRVTAEGAAPVTIAAMASAPPAGTFRIEVRYVTGTEPTASQRAAFDQAAAKWTSLILRGGAPYPVHEVSAGCGDISGETVDGVVIFADLKPIDGAGKVLGSAGPCILRDADYIPAQGVMQFDTADLATLETRGQLEQVILHEMAHVLGFGTLWGVIPPGGAAGTRLLKTPAEDPTFLGKASRAAFFGLASTGYAGAAVPVENTGAEGTAFSHWRETIFSKELMTGWLDGGSNPLSALTIAQFRDLGYEVNDALGEAYSFVAMLQQSQAGTAPVQLIEGKLLSPLIVINRAGRRVATFPRVYK
jgi:hypothetical protein